jgi:hypothetical protein
MSAVLNAVSVSTATVTSNTTLVPRTTELGPTGENAAVAAAAVLTDASRRKLDQTIAGFFITSTLCVVGSLV